MPGQVEVGPVECQKRSQVKSRQIKSSQVTPNQVKSRQVKSSPVTRLGGEDQRGKVVGVAAGGAKAGEVRLGEGVRQRVVDRGLLGELRLEGDDLPKRASMGDEMR
jgi:hypothetical protein